MVAHYRVDSFYRISSTKQCIKRERERKEVGGERERRRGREGGKREKEREREELNEDNQENQDPELLQHTI